MDGTDGMGKHNKHKQRKKNKKNGAKERGFLIKMISLSISLFSLQIPEWSHLPLLLLY